VTISWIWEYLLPFAAVLGTVVLFHEFGHYLVAKLLGITVEVFSVGFGPRLWGFAKGGTDYRLSLVPLGGYVKLKGETEEETGPRDPGDLLSRSRWQRFLVFVMGAVFNLATAFVLTAVIFTTGVREHAYLYEPPLIGEVETDSPAAAAGIQAGDRIVAFDGRPVPTWRDLQLAIALNPGQTREIAFERGGEHRNATLRIDTGPGEVGRVGFQPQTGVLVLQVVPGRPADRAGLRPGDRLVSIGGVPITTVGKVLTIIQGSPEQPLEFVLDRDGTPYTRTITPIREEGRGLIGFVPTPPTVERSYGVFAAMRESVSANLQSVGLVFLTFKKLFTGQLSLRAVSGPIELYLVTGRAAQEGLIPFLQFIAFVSLQLGIINLFPIPPLDGGQIFTLLIEGTIRRDLSMQFKERFAQAGLILLLLFMVAVIYLDIDKIFLH
jgi:regulator of sigma E protease